MKTMIAIETITELIKFTEVHPSLPKSTLTDDKSVRILNRVASWTIDGTAYEPDQRHADAIIEGLDLGGHDAHGVSTPGDENLRERKGDAIEKGSNNKPRGEGAEVC